jgi:hypothetical protein
MRRSAAVRHLNGGNVSKMAVLPSVTIPTAYCLLSFIDMNTPVFQFEDAHAIWLNSFVDIPNHSILYSQRIVIAKLNIVKFHYFY